MSSTDHSWDIWAGFAATVSAALYAAAAVFYLKEATVWLVDSSVWLATGSLVFAVICFVLARTYGWRDRRNSERRWFREAREQCEDTARQLEDLLGRYPDLSNRSHRNAILAEYRRSHAVQVKNTISEIGGRCDTGNLVALRDGIEAGHVQHVPELANRLRKVTGRQLHWRKSRRRKFSNERA